MKIIILKPGISELKYSIFGDNMSGSCSGKISGYRGTGDVKWALSMVKEELLKLTGSMPGENVPFAVGIHSVYGGAEFTAPVMFDEETEKRLGKITGRSPLHVPAVIETAKGCMDIFPSVPVVILFETAFFCGLPDREKNYAIDPQAAYNKGLSRSGYHGLMHEAACKFAASKQGGSLKIISLCLEPRPELAAIDGTKPVMVTAGATPLEGLIGDRSCGDLDAGIIIKLSKEYKWSIETINRLLTEESGITGLVGESANIDGLFLNGTLRYKKAKKIFLYQLLKTCGSAIAAMSGLDIIVLSGRYTLAAESIGPWLNKKLSVIAKRNGVNRPVTVIMYEKMDEILAKKTIAFIAGKISVKS